ncbi:aldehyde dehydrogenase PuuC, partial [Burkholderia multivorans]
MTDTLTRTPAAEEWRTKAAAITLDGRPVIDGVRVEAQSGQTHAKTNPATGEAIPTPHLGEGPDVDRAVATPRRAYDD